MKKIFDICTQMIYPMLISIFIVFFALTFMTSDDLKPVESLFITLYYFIYVFGALFIIGFLGNIIYTIVCDVKHKK